MAAASARAGNEPPILAYQAWAADDANVTRRLETYPLAAAAPGRFIDMAEVDEAEALLRVHPALRFASVSPKGTICSEVPVGLGPVENAPSDLGSGAPPATDRRRRLSLVVFSTAAADALTLVTAPEGVPRPLPAGPDGAVDDPHRIVRREMADRLRSAPDSLSLQKHGEFDFDGDGRRELLFVGTSGSLNAGGGADSLLAVAAPGLLLMPIYSMALPPGGEVMGVGDIDGDGRAEIVVRTGLHARDFGVEIHGWRGRTLQKVFERRSYGCF